MGRRYTATFENVTVSAIQDLFEINAPATKSVQIIGCVLGQTSDAGDVNDEILRVRFINGFTASGSGGSAPTAAPLDTGDPAYGGTCEANNTTVANTGTTTQPWTDTFNIRAGWVYWPPPEARIIIPGARRLVLNLPAAPADAISLSGTIVFEEMG